MKKAKIAGVILAVFCAFGLLIWVVRPSFGLAVADTKSAWNGYFEASESNVSPLAAYFTDPEYILLPQLNLASPCLNFDEMLCCSSVKYRHILPPRALPFDKIPRKSTQRLVGRAITLKFNVKVTTTYTLRPHERKVSFVFFGENMSFLPLTYTGVVTKDTDVIVIPYVLPSFVTTIKLSLKDGALTVDVAVDPPDWASDWMQVVGVYYQYDNIRPIVYNR